MLWVSTVLSMAVLTIIFYCLTVVKNIFDLLGRTPTGTQLDLFMWVKLPLPQLHTQRSTLSSRWANYAMDMSDHSQRCREPMVSVGTTSLMKWWTGTARMRLPILFSRVTLREDYPDFTLRKYGITMRIKNGFKVSLSLTFSIDKEKSKNSTPIGTGLERTSKNTYQKR